MRVASLAPSVTHMLQELDAAEHIVACTHQCPLPSAQRLQLAVGSFAALDTAKLAATQPDLIVTATVVQASGSHELADSGARVLHLDPRSLQDIADTYATLGAALGRAKQGEALRRAFADQLAALEAAPQPARRVTVYMEEWHEPPFVAGNWIPDMVRLAGGTAVLALPHEPSRRITLEELQAADPDVIVQHVCLPPGNDWTISRQHMAEALKRRPGWDTLRAVRHGRVYPMEDSPFNTPTRGILAGIPLLREVLLAVPA